MPRSNRSRLDDIQRVFNEALVAHISEFLDGYYFCYECGQGERVRLRDIVEEEIKSRDKTITDLRKEIKDLKRRLEEADRGLEFIKQFEIAKKGS